MSNKLFSAVVILAAVVAVLVFAGSALAVQSPTFMVSTPLYDSGWLEIPDNGRARHKHNLNAHPTIYDVYVANNGYGACPIPILDYANHKTGMRVVELTPTHIALRFGTERLAYSTMAKRWYNRTDYYRLVIYDTDSQWSTPLGIGPCRP